MTRSRRPELTLARPLAFSLLAHVLLIAGLRFGREPERAPPSTPAPEAADATMPRAIPVTLLQAARPRAGRGARIGHGGRARGSRIGRASAPAPFGRWGVALPSPRRGGRTDADAVLGTGSGGVDGFAFADGLGLAEEGRHYPFFDALWRRIEARVPYPDDFVRQWIRGEVSAQIEVDRRGVFTGRIVGAEAPPGTDGDLLKTYVLAALVAALREPLPPNRWAERDRVILVARFRFRVFTDGEARVGWERPMFKNQLAFNRESYSVSRLNLAVERVFTRYLPPIIPLPGGAFYIDFFRAYELVRGIGKPREEDRRADRVELQRRRWEQALRRSAVPGPAG